MKYIVLGCVHGIQPPELTPAFIGVPTLCSCCVDRGIEPSIGELTCQHVQDQRSRFRQLLTNAIDQHGIEFIAEEWGRPEKTIAHELAGPRHYCNINTSDGDLDRMRIPRDYLSRVNGQHKYGEVQTKIWLKQREEFMVSRTKEEHGESQSVLVICGFEHLYPISDLLRRDRTAVFPVDYRQAVWYRPDVFTED